MSPPLSFDNSLFFDEDYYHQTFDLWPTKIWSITLSMKKLNKHKELLEGQFLLKNQLTKKKIPLLRTTSPSWGVILQFLPFITTLHFTFFIFIFDYIIPLIPGHESPYL
jgi:hypothetical protein